MQIQLPKLKRIDSEQRTKKKKIFLICDDIKYVSGVATIAREIVVGTSNHYDWVQLAAAIQHHDHGKIINLSDEIAKETGYDDVYVKQYCHNGYGNADVIREIISYEQPDAILLITDPRFFTHVFLMEHELRSEFKIPLMYLQIWDNLPVPYWNSSAYGSCNLLMSINKQTKVLNKITLQHKEISFEDLDSVGFDVETEANTLLSYVPHGSSIKYYFKQDETSRDWHEYQRFKQEFIAKYDSEFVVFYNSRNIRRKQPGDVILSFKQFLDLLPAEKAKKCVLVMKTAVQDENGTDLWAVKQALCPDAKIVFIDDYISSQKINWFYNLADCTFFMSSAEGFGLAANESLLCGTMVIAPVTGGLQDQMRFEDENGNWVEFTEDFTTNHRGKYKKCGPWAYPIFPKVRALQGSIPTPYIFDDYSSPDDAAEGLLYIYNLGKDNRDSLGLEGQTWVMGEESGMSSPKMCQRIIRSIDTTLRNFKPKSKYLLKKVNERKPYKYTGIQF